jgi:hypothetical protein
MGPWKGVKPQPDSPIELYDVVKDIGETKDLAAANSDVVARIAGIMKSARTGPIPESRPAGRKKK